MRHALAAALLALPALLAQLSGCSGVGGGGTGAQSPSLPPAEVPDVTPAPSPARDATRWLADYSASAGVSKSWKCSPRSFERMFSAAAAPSPAEITACHSWGRTIAPAA